jgi:two-component system alkaline phosphatase synthesis response regulator PhoP
MFMHTVLVVDDEKNIRELIKINLEMNQYSVLTASDGNEAIELLRKVQLIDLAIIDLMLPGIDGIEVCRFIRRDDTHKDLPVIMLTAKGTEHDKVHGLEMGADDYVTKPFSTKELLARVKSQLRRVERDKNDQLIIIRNLELNIKEHMVFVNRHEVTLTLKEFELLKLLALNRGKVYTRDELLDLVWGYDYFGETRTVDVHVRHLRKKIGCFDEENEYIETIRGVGYKIR